MRVWSGVEGRMLKTFDVRGEQVSLVIRQLPLVLLANVINPILTAGVLAAVVPVAEIALWAGMLVGLTSFRFCQIRMRKVEPPIGGDPARWVLRLALGAPPRHAFGNFRLPVGDRACPAATRRPALSPVHRFRPGRHGGRIGRDTVAAASSRDRLPAALHAAAGDPSESGGNPRLAWDVGPYPAVHLWPVDCCLEDEPLDCRHAPPEDGEMQACR